MRLACLPGFIEEMDKAQLRIGIFVHELMLLVCVVLQRIREAFWNSRNGHKEDQELTLESRVLGF